MTAPHPLVVQLRFTRAEFARTIRGVADDDARRRFEPMNCLAWNVGHLAWQEQRYFLTVAQERTPRPDIADRFASGGPASTPSLAEVVEAWRAITAEADPWLDTLTSEGLLARPVRHGRPLARTFGNLLQRTIYHYWYHAGENMAIRQLLGHDRLPQFVGDIDDQAPYRPEDPARDA
jgi:uncharacterized damage-inducible protein DinB